nr:hypothetical protein [Micromonospora sp. DSM 115978]
RIVADGVFLNAGSPGTTRLLVKARAKGLVPDLPDAVGTQWGNNGDRIFAWIGMNGDPGTVQGGPACVGGRDLTSSIPLTIIHAGSPQQIPGIKLMTVVGFGVVQAAGTWAYDPNTDDAKLTWPASGDAALQQLIAAKMQAIDVALARRRADGGRSRQVRPGAGPPRPVRHGRSAHPGLHRGLQPVYDDRRPRRAQHVPDRAVRRRTGLLTLA